MTQVLVGGLVGIVVAVASHLVTIGGYMRRSRATMKDELDLLSRLDPQHELTTELRDRVHTQLASYLGEPTRLTTEQLWIRLVVTNGLLLLPLVALMVVTRAMAGSLEWLDLLIVLGVFVAVVVGALCQMYLWRRVRP